MAHQIAAFRAAGMSGAVAKPISLSALLSAFARIVGNDSDCDQSAVA